MQGNKTDILTAELADELSELFPGIQQFGHVIGAAEAVLRYAGVRVDALVHADDFVWLQAVCAAMPRADYAVAERLIAFAQSFEETAR